MKHFLKAMLFVVTIFCTTSAHAVYVNSMPVTQFQPNGQELHFYATGDECYHRYHDSNNYTIMQAPSGWWVYAEADGQGGMRPSDFRVGTVDPASVGIAPGLTITRGEWLALRSQWTVPERYRIPQAKTSGRNHGDFCNLVIFIRFADDTHYTRPLSAVDKMFSDSSSSTSVSVYNYFKHASYNKLFVRTYYAPTPQGNQILSYQSPHPRNYYMPYTASNTIGYSNYRERTEREFELLVGAVNFINDSFPVPNTYNLDCDNDGYIDNVNFVVKGGTAGWSDLLWPHKWNLYGHNVYINGKQVNTFNFALEGSGDNYFGTSTFCHEMFHSLGAPDLYRYSQSDEIAPVGPWDLMATNSRPPQHMGAYMKYKYGNWIDSIPLVTTPGTYTLNSVADSTPDNIALRFPSADENQFYVVEYRDNTETFETKLPGRGLLIYRIDTRFDGNANFDGEENFDEIWLFRPGSNSNSESGQLNEAYFAPNRHRTEFSPSTSYYPYLSDGTPDMSFTISNITSPGNTISFRYTNRCKPAQLETGRITTATAAIKWKGNANAYTVYYRPVGSNEPFKHRTVFSTHTTLSSLLPNTQYEWTVRGLFEPQGNTFADSSQLPQTVTFMTAVCNNALINVIDNGSNQENTGMPFVNNENYNYSQQIYLASELSGAQNITSISINYAYTVSLTKQNCTVYLAHTSLAQFDDTTSPVPFAQLTPVFVGDITFSQGWNDIMLETPFQYNGTDNLVIAIDDNSNSPSRVGDKFYVHNTDNPLAVIYHSNYTNPNPASDTIKGSRQRQWFRDNLKINGCPVNNNQIYACILSDNEDLGTVSGEGYYLPDETITIHAYPKSGNRFTQWSDGNTDNPRNLTLIGDTVLVAFFHSPLGIDQDDSKPGYIILTRQQQITICGAESQPIVIYDLLGRPVASTNAHHADNIFYNLPSTGVYIIRIGNEKPLKMFIP